MSTLVLIIFNLISCSKDDPEPYLKVNKSQINFKLPNILADTMNISSNVTWNISSTSDWINVTPTNSSGDNIQVIVKVNENLATTIREASVIIANDDKTLTRSITIKQYPRVLVVAGDNGMGSNLNQLNHPSAVFIDDNKSLFITDQFNHRVVKWEPNSSQGILVAGGNTSGNELDQLNNPYGIFVKPSGDMYISDNNNDRILKWRAGMSSGTIIAGGNGNGIGLNQLNNPNCVYVIDNDVYVSDSSRVMIWTEGSEQGVVFPHNGFPIAVSLDIEGNVYIADNLDQSVYKWIPGSTEGIVVAGGNGSGSNLNQFENISGIYVDDDGNVFVVDQTNNRVVKWTVGASTGIVVAGGNGRGSDIHQLNSPSGISLDNDGNIYISDQANNRIVKWLK